LAGGEFFTLVERPLLAGRQTQVAQARFGDDLCVADELGGECVAVAAGKSIIEKSDACCYQPKKQLKKSASNDFAGDVNNLRQ
jgi:hypothetical protein